MPRILDIQSIPAKLGWMDGWIVSHLNYRENDQSGQSFFQFWLGYNLKLLGFYKPEILSGNLEIYRILASRKIQTI